MTHLSTRFLAALNGEDGSVKLLDTEFYIQNWRDFTENPYHFDLPEKEFNVLDFGAKGDGFTDDTKAIQKAIDVCAKAGGGRVVLPGEDGPVGRRYVATHLTLRSNIDFHIDAGAVLWQSYDLRDYDYLPVFNHDFVIPDCPWTHCLFINKPLLQANRVDHLKITGPGKLRMADPSSLNPDWSHYAATCSDRIHICPLTICESGWIEFTDIDIIRTNNYHMSLASDEKMFIGNVKLYEVRCVSGDGFSFSQGSHDIKVSRGFFDSNDDGLVLCTSYRDPRGKVSAWRLDHDEADHSIRNITLEHSYINSGENAGKAVALIPWGSTNPDLTKQEIDNVSVYDCVLMGGHSVGTWCDNPFDGKTFTNGEEDDYSPVKHFRILNNEYRSKCDILCVKPTDFITDCGLHSSAVLKNPAFVDGVSYWTVSEEVKATDGRCTVKSGSVTQGLWMQSGRHTFSARVNGVGRLVAMNSLSGEILASREFCLDSDEPMPIALSFELPSAGEYSVGIITDKEVSVGECAFE
ncbi:MAG: hypothetical protein HUJ91_05075 [Bacteroidales bacterium]|nr:hypothetical protein [Bacteroidales bacterium]